MARTTENIGLLFVHGIGEQKKLEHLTACAREFAALVAESDGLIRLDVRDECEKAGRFTIDAVYARGPRIGPPDRVRVQLHLHEVWWADLGASGGLGEQIRFWLWSLGQWAAQVVREGNPRRNTMKLMDMPSFDARSGGRAAGKRRGEGGCREESGRGTRPAVARAGADAAVRGWNAGIPHPVQLVGGEAVVSFLAQRPALAEPDLPLPRRREDL